MANRNWSPLSWRTALPGHDTPNRMTFRVTDTTLLFSRQDFRAAADAIKKAAVGGNFSAAARTLGVNYRTMTRWLGTLLDKGIDVREELQLEPGGGQSSASRLAGQPPEVQRERILAAIRRAGGTVPPAAIELGVSSQRIYKLIRTLGLTAEVEKMRHDPALVGTRVPTRRPGRPKGAPLARLLAEQGSSMDRATRRALEQLLDLGGVAKRRSQGVRTF